MTVSENHERLAGSSLYREGVKSALIDVINADFQKTSFAEFYPAIQKKALPTVKLLFARLKLKVDKLAGREDAKQIRNKRNNREEYHELNRVPRGNGQVEMLLQQ